MGKMKDIWTSPKDYPKELVWKINGGKERWISVHVVAIPKKKSKQKPTEQILDASFLDKVKK